MQRTMMQIVAGTCVCASTAMAYDPGPNVIYGTEFTNVAPNGGSWLRQLGDTDVRIQISDFFIGSSHYIVNVHAPFDPNNPAGMQMWGPQDGTAWLTEGADNSTWIETDYYEYPGVTLYQYTDFPEFLLGTPTTPSDPQVQHGFRTADGRFGFLQFTDHGFSRTLTGWALQLEPEATGFRAFDVLTIPAPGAVGLLAIAGFGAARRRRSG